MVLIIAAVHAKIKKNHNMMSMNFQKTPGQQIVIIQDIIIIIAKDINNQNGRD
jgi:orotate phosphoribosyltransferase-like protein